jgi:hypothetical protein
LLRPGIRIGVKGRLLVVAGKSGIEYEYEYDNDHEYEQEHEKGRIGWDGRVYCFVRAGRAGALCWCGRAGC